MIERDLCHSVDVDHRGVLVLVLGRSSMVEWLCEKMAHRQSGPGDSPRPAGLKIRFQRDMSMNVVMVHTLDRYVDTYRTHLHM